MLWTRSAGAARAPVRRILPPTEATRLESARHSDAWSERFHRLCSATSRGVGHPLGFASAILVLLAWGLAGPLFGFSDTWQLLINTGTTVVTFLMVFLIQHSQNRDSASIHLKLDELIRSISGAHNTMIDLEGLSDDELDRLRKRYERLAREAAQRRTGGSTDTDTPDVPSSE